MEFREFIKHRRLSLGISQQQLAERLSDLGQEASPARVGHWETGRNHPPLDNARFRLALALALELDINDMMTRLGYIITDEDRSLEAKRAADIVDQLPPERRELAVSVLEQFLRARTG